MIKLLILLPMFMNSAVAQSFERPQIQVISFMHPFHERNLPGMSRKDHFQLWSALDLAMGKALSGPTFYEQFPVKVEVTNWGASTTINRETAEYDLSIRFFISMEKQCSDQSFKLDFEALASISFKDAHALKSELAFEIDSVNYYAQGDSTKMLPLEGDAARQVLDQVLTSSLLINEQDQKIILENWPSNSYGLYDKVYQSMFEQVFYETTPSFPIYPPVSIYTDSSLQPTRFRNLTPRLNELCDLNFAKLH